MLSRIASRIAGVSHEWKNLGQKVEKTRREDAPVGAPQEVGVWWDWECSKCGQHEHTALASQRPEATGCSARNTN